MPRVILATRNQHKVNELRQILSAAIPGFQPDWLGSAQDFDTVEPVEDGVDFAENSLIKARQVVKDTGLPAIADDSGICVEIMGGAPGIFSARWSGAHGDDVGNRNLLLHQLADVPERNRGAYFMCAACLVMPDGREFVEIGKMTGHLSFAAAGDSGFGYDPIFIPTGYSVTNAELSPEEKNAISHRAKAFNALAKTLQAELL
ncbi:non-canonical purine NTP pyrophosphatase, RdgB/HAM1 family [Boudabousia marimammalium]|uniref:dITP/XTP pyrophosphatase n=1 Tax=Boudabousia marimammalium TaxID=156892 RepID=A0A1Q5PM52_9ACTO|nr:non-canonical purine NTP pyrophosphatase, RdgB/HAM1 family [Boudabousia marimammalium]